MRRLLPVEHTVYRTRGERERALANSRLKNPDFFPWVSAITGGRQARGGRRGALYWQIIGIPEAWSRVNSDFCLILLCAAAGKLINERLVLCYLCGNFCPLCFERLSTGEVVHLQSGSMRWKETAAGNTTEGHTPHFRVSLIQLQFVYDWVTFCGLTSCPFRGSSSNGIYL